MHLMSVDLPEPEGPHTTTTSPCAMEVVQLRSTWKLPNHLLTFEISIIANLPLADRSGRRKRAQYRDRHGLSR
jgi:hypothetical protein